MRKTLRYSCLLFILLISNYITAQYNFSNHGEVSGIPSIVLKEIITDNSTKETIAYLKTTSTSSGIRDVEYFTKKIGDKGVGKNIKAEYKNIDDNTWKVFIKGEVECGGVSDFYIRARNFSGWSLYDLKLNHEFKNSKPPEIISFDPVVVELENDGTYTVTEQDLNYEVIDPCGGKVTVNFPKQLPVTCDDINQNVKRNIKFVGSSGKELAYTFPVKVLDKRKPTITPVSQSVTLGKNGTVTVDAKELYFDFTEDNCKIETWELSKSTFTCDDIGSNEVTLTVIDSSGNKASEIVTFKVEDSGELKAKAKDIKLALGKNGTVTLDPEQINDSEGTACGFNASVSPNKFTCDDIGENIVTLTIESKDGSTKDTDKAVVTIVDESGPEIISINTPKEIEIKENGKGELTEDLITYKTEDNCGKVTINFKSSSYTCDDVEKDFTKVITFKDEAGNKTPHEFSFKVVDKIFPKIKVKDITKALDADTKEITITEKDLDDGSSDNCEIAGWELSQKTFTCDDLGENEIEVTVFDKSGNKDKAKAIITITGENGTGKPKAKAKDATVSLNSDGTYELTPSEVNDTGELFCDYNITVTPNKFDCDNVNKENIVTLTISDDKGYESKDTAKITVLDNEAPKIDDNAEAIVYIGKDGIGKLSKETAKIKAKDNCTLEEKLEITFSPNTEYSCDDIGSDKEVTIIVLDEYKNKSEKTIPVTILDEIAPVIKVKNITKGIDGNTKQVIITGDDIDDGSSDNCKIVDFKLSKNTFTCDDLGENKITAIAIDKSGNESEPKEVIIKVTGANGDGDPVAKAKDATLTLDPKTGKVNLEVGQVNDSGELFCNYEFTVTPNTFDCSNVNKQNTVTLKISDGKGYESTDTAIVTIKDTDGPIITPKENVTLPIDEKGDVIIKIEEITTSITDNCGVKSKDVDKKAIKCTDVVDGKATIIVIAEDVNGNTTKQEVEIKVDDAINPIAKAKNITISLTDKGTETITAEQIDDNSSDNCGIAKMTLDRDTFTCDDIDKENKVTLTVVDFNGNSSTATAIVTVDGIAEPVAKALDIELPLEDDGTASLTPQMLDANNALACAAEASVSRGKFTCADLGTPVEVTLTVKGSASSSSDIGIVTVVDKIKPTAIAKSGYIVGIGIAGSAILKASDLNNNSTDNCPENLTFKVNSKDEITVTCDDIGDKEVTFTAVDASKNEHTVKTTITVIDKAEVNIVTKNIERTLNSNGEVTITKEDVDGGSTYGCGESALVLDKTLFTCADIGENTVTLSTIDKSQSATAIVTILDKEVPTVVTKDITRSLGQEGVTVVDPTEIDNGSFDNCKTIKNLSLDKAIFTCEDIGKTHEVVLTATDESGNISTGKANVTIEAPVGLPDVKTRDITLKLKEDGTLTLSPEQVLETASSVSCSYTSVLNKTEFDCSDVGENTVTVTLKGNNGTTKSGNAIVTIEDAVKPIAIARKSLVVNLQGDETTKITVQDIDDGSSDNCGIDTIEIDMDTFDEPGDYPVILKVTDIGGKSSLAYCIVTVISKDLEGDVLIYPNPVKDILNFVSNNKIKQISLYSSLGQLMFQTENIDDPEIDLSDLDTGIFFIKFIDTEDNVIVKTLAKE